MNERIRELAEQAYTEVMHERGGTYMAFDKEKFAELIVRECMACSTWVGKNNTNLVEPVHTSHAINQRIKQHFGVEA
jgi:hypothetical protein